MPNDLQSPILDAKGVTVDFGKFRALNSVDLSVAPGERVALLGHNGAGKSTLFKAILGFVGPSNGAIAIAGGTPGSMQARQAVSYLPESVAFPKTLTGQEILTYFARLKSVEHKKALHLLEVVGLKDAGHRRVGTYSKGMRQRLGLAQALIGEPRLLLLDEPTSGLDPVSRREFYELIEMTSSKGTAVLLSSHALTEVEGKTDRIAILSRGKLVADGPLRLLAQRADLPIIVNIHAKDGQADEIQRRVGGRRFNGSTVLLSCSADEKLKVIAGLADLGDRIDDFDIVPPGLDDIYRFYSAGEASGEKP